MNIVLSEECCLNKYTIAEKRRDEKRNGGVEYPVLVLIAECKIIAVL